MRFKDLFIDFDPMPVKAIPVIKARLCPDCDNIVEGATCPFCARGTFPIHGVSTGVRYAPEITYGAKPGTKKAKGDIQ